MQESASNCSASEIVDRLYMKYYENNCYSEETSSHWRKYGEFQKVVKLDGVWLMSGVGFGDYAPTTLARKIFYLPTNIYLYFMLRLADRGIVRLARSLATRVGRMFSYDIARNILASELLKRYSGGFEGKTIAIIGDGYGALGSLLKAMFPTARVIYINLGRTLLFDVFYTALAFPSLDHKLISDTDMPLSNDFSYVEAEGVRKVMVEADLFINIASMQEMNPDAISEYFSIMRSQRGGTLFYCCNRIKKELPDGAISKFVDYGWRDSDEVLLDELCPWHQHAPKNRPPFVYWFDGPIQHRLVRMESL